MAVVATVPLTVQPTVSLPTRVEMSEPISVGERIADSAARLVGSWRFIIIQSILVVIWIGFNIWELGLGHFDPFPFVLLNLMFSVQAAYTGPVLLLAGNRQSLKDRLTLEHAAKEAERTEQHELEVLQEIRRNSEMTLKILELLERQSR